MNKIKVHNKQTKNTSSSAVRTKGASFNLKSKIGDITNYSKPIKNQTGNQSTKLVKKNGK